MFPYISARRSCSCERGESCCVTNFKELLPRETFLTYFLLTGAGVLQFLGQVACFSTSDHLAIVDDMTAETVSL